jgi:hypothetical protein
MWVYVQIAYESGSMLAVNYNYAHETFLGKRNGMSEQDYALGLYGVFIGKTCIREQ